MSLMNMQMRVGMMIDHKWNYGFFSLLLSLSLSLSLSLFYDFITPHAGRRSTLACLVDDKIQWPVPHTQTAKTT